MTTRLDDRALASYLEGYKIRAATVAKRITALKAAARLPQHQSEKDRKYYSETIASEQLYHSELLKRIVDIDSYSILRN